MHPLLMDRAGDGKVLLVVVTADSGLCGGFNANLIKAARAYVQKHGAGNVDLFCIGRKGRDFFRKNSYPVVGQKAMFFNALKYNDAVDAVSKVKDLYLEGGYARPSFCR